MSIRSVYNSDWKPCLTADQMNTLKAGDQVLYDEDGQIILCKVLANKSTQRDYLFGLEVVELKKSNGVYTDPVVGEQFEAFGMKGAQHYWGWVLRPM
jgi:hypothetical protein